MYVPDGDPTSAVFSSNPERGVAPKTLLRREFFTASGLVHYTYDPAQLIDHFRDVLLEKPLPQAKTQPQARLAIVRTPQRPGLARTDDGFTFVAPLGAPLSQYAIRSFVQAAHGATGWENARYISVLVSFIAVALTAVGAGMALRGLKRESETMKLRGALIANVSHELRTPLSMIRLGAETLKRSAKLKAGQREEIEDSILREVLHLSHLVENVLDIARIQNRKAKALAFAPVHPRELVMTVVTTYESWLRSKGFEVALRIDDPVDEQLWDREAVSRALLNLIDNAVKYSGDQKSLAVVLRQTPEHVIIEVVDNGIGIEEVDLSHIFEPYYRAQFSDTQTRRGAGLGLTLVHQIVTSHGGRVEVDSKRGEGSSFRMMFPRSQSTAERPVAALSHAPQAF
jgi:signal transduction histidine kinase